MLLQFKGARLMSGHDLRYALLDYAAFTLPVEAGQDVLLSFFPDYQLRRNRDGELLGALGYSTSARLPQGGLCAWGGNNDTMHFSLPGGCLGWMWEAELDVWGLIAFVVDHRAGHLTRLDVAFDDRSGSLTVDRCRVAWSDGWLVSRYRTCQYVETLERGSDSRGGATLYLGSSSSDSRVRIYDKRAEQGLGDEALPWFRLEFQARRGVADRLAELICRGGLDAAAEVVSSYVQLRVPSVSDDTKARWPVLSAWAALMGVLRRGLGLPGPRVRLGRSMGWVERQMGTTLAAIREAVGPVAFAGWLRECVLEGVSPQRVETRLLAWGVA